MIAEGLISMKITLFNSDGLQTISPPDLKAFLTTQQEVVWIDIADPTPPTMALLGDIYHFHPLALEDTCNQQQRPKVEEYADHLFIIINALTEHDKTIHFHEIDIFLGKNYIVTAHTESDNIIEDVRRRIEREGNFKYRSADYLLYMVIDTVVDAYFPLLDQIEDEINQINEQLFLNPNQKTLPRLFQLRRSLSETARIASQQRDMFIILTRHEQDLINHSVLEYYFRDVYDHLLRIGDVTNSLRDNLTNTVDLYLSSSANRLNIVVNRLAVITIVTGALSVIVGFYGMNFLKTWPPFEVEWGVPFALGLMAIITITVLVVFKRWKWY